MPPEVLNVGLSVADIAGSVCFVIYITPDLIRGEE